MNEKIFNTIVFIYLAFCALVGYLVRCKLVDFHYYSENLAGLIGVVVCFVSFFGGVLLADWAYRLIKRCFTSVENTSLAVNENKDAGLAGHSHDDYFKMLERKCDWQEADGITINPLDKDTMESANKSMRLMSFELYLITQKDDPFDVYERSGVDFKKKYEDKHASHFPNEFERCVALYKEYVNKVIKLHMRGLAVSNGTFRIIELIGDFADETQAVEESVVSSPDEAKSIVLVPLSQKKVIDLECFTGCHKECTEQEIDDAKCLYQFKLWMEKTNSLVSDIREHTDLIVRYYNVFYPGQGGFRGFEECFPMYRSYEKGHNKKPSATLREGAFRLIFIMTYLRNQSLGFMKYPGEAIIDLSNF